MLLIEQNIGVATAVADHVAIMVNGRINRVMTAGELAADRELQQRLLGVGRQDEDERRRAPAETGARRERRGAAWRRSIASNAARPRRAGRSVRDVYRPRARAARALEHAGDEPARVDRRGVAAPTPEGARIFSHPVRRAHRPHRARRRHLRHQGPRAAISSATGSRRSAFRPARSISRPRASRRPPTCSPRRWRACIRAAARGLLRRSRPARSTAMAEAFARWIARERDIGGIISAGGSGGTTLATAGMRALPVGMPKVMVSTVASGDVARLCRRQPTS